MAGCSSPLRDHEWHIGGESAGHVVKSMLHRLGTQCHATQDVRLNRTTAAAIVKSDAFETAIGALIILNSITMGIGAETLLGRASGLKGFVTVCDNIFTVCFLLELLLRVYVCGWRSFVPFTGDMFNFFDAVIVLVTGVLTVWILPLFSIASNKWLRTISVLRVCRLVRLVRVVSKVKMLKEVWQLMQGLAESMRTLFWTVIVIGCITYIFAVFGVVLIGSELQANVQASVGSVDPELEELMELFDGIFSTMQTLIQVLILDSVHGILFPLMRYVGWSWMYIYAYISVAVIVLLNLVTAIIVENAIAKSRKDEKLELAEKENDKKRLLQQFRSLFSLIDIDGDGLLTWAEFETAFDVPEVATKLKMLDFDADSCRELFHLLDNGDGALSLEEFFEGISNMYGNARAKDSFKLLKVTSTVQRSLQQLANDMEEDHQQMMMHTPGCRPALRTGSLRARSVAAGANSVVSSPSRSGLASGDVAPASARHAAPSPPCADTPVPAAAGPQPPQEPPSTAADGLAFSSPDVSALRRVPRPLAFSSDVLCPIQRECSVGSDGDVSPAMKLSRRKQLGIRSSFGLESVTESTTLTRVHEVAEQVNLCNGKVEVLANAVGDLHARMTNSVSDLQASMALVLQKLDGHCVQQMFATLPLEAGPQTPFRPDPRTPPASSDQTRSPQRPQLGGQLGGMPMAGRK